eukprot:SAG31_NODE_522_length_14623_cov_6.071674_8_plen_280_part_00
MFCFSLLTVVGNIIVSRVEAHIALFLLLLFYDRFFMTDGPVTVPVSVVLLISASIALTRTAMNERVSLAHRLTVVDRYRANPMLKPNQHPNLGGKIGQHRGWLWKWRPSVRVEEKQEAAERVLQLTQRLEALRSSNENDASANKRFHTHRAALKMELAVAIRRQQNLASRHDGSWRRRYCDIATVIEGRLEVVVSAAQGPLPRGRADWIGQVLTRCGADGQGSPAETSVARTNPCWNDGRGEVLSFSLPDVPTCVTVKLLRRAVRLFNSESIEPHRILP